jgi:hypothetical protein
MIGVNGISILFTHFLAPISCAGTCIAACVFFLYMHAYVLVWSRRRFREVRPTMEVTGASQGHAGSHRRDALLCARQIYYFWVL